MNNIKLAFFKNTCGRIAVVNSIASRSFSQISGIEYTASKAALSGIVKQLAIDFLNDGILINSVFPSMTNTPMLQKSVTPQRNQKETKTNYRPRHEHVEHNSPRTPATQQLKTKLKQLKMPGK